MKISSLVILFSLSCYANGQFGPEQVISTNFALAYHLFVEDLDLDGDLDFALGLRSTSSGIWFSNDGAGNFTQQQVFSPNS